MVTSFDILQEIISIDMLTALKSSLKHRRKHVLQSLQPYGDQALSNYRWTRLAVRIIGAIKRQFFHMVTHVLTHSNLSQEIFAIDTWRAVVCFLGHGRKHMLKILLTIWDRALISYLTPWRVENS